MHAFHNSRYRNQIEGLIYVTLQLLKYSTYPNDATLYIEKSQALK